MLVISAWPALILFALVSSITPGPNNIMLLVSGVNFGFQRTIPHMLGICAGFFVLCIAIGLGIGAFLQQFPVLHKLLQVVCAIYLVYLGIQIARSRTFSPQSAQSSHPMSFFQAALFQWVNPKAWMMAISAMIMFSQASAPWVSMGWIAAIFALITLPCIAIWTVFGVLIKGLLSQPLYLRWFNRFMGLLLILSIYPMFSSSV